MELMELRDDALDWCRGRWWIWRAPLLLYFAYAGFRYLTDPGAGSWFSGITLGIHELGHVLTAPFGQFLMAAGGSLAQVLAPIAAGLVLMRQRDYFGMTVAASWLSFSLFELARYIADARTQALPLVGLGSDVQHDWHFLLSRMGLLSLDHFFGWITILVALFLLLASLVAGSWLCHAMAVSKQQAK